MKIKVIHPGLLASVQDLGRPAWRSEGVPTGGAVDVLHHCMANFTVGNFAEAATVELSGGQFAAWVEAGGWLSLAGPGGRLLLDGRVVPSGRCVFAPAGALLEVHPASEGNYSYLATAGGWQAPEVLSSRSACLPGGFGGLYGRALQKGDTLSASVSADENGRKDVDVGAWFAVPPAFPFFGKPAVPIRVLAGPESGLFREDYRRRFFEAPFTVSRRRDRMGVALHPGAETTPYDTADMPSTAVMPGTIQVPPDGHPVALLADAQTTGGYPRIAQVAAVDIPLLAQIPTGQSVCFQEITLEEAERLFFIREKLLRKTQLALHFKFREYAKY